MATPHTIDEDELRQCIAGILRERGEEPSSITDIQHQPSEYASWYGGHVVTVRRPRDTELKLYLKDFGGYSSEKEDMAARREREYRVYRDLLAGADLGTAAYFGSLWDPPQGRFWLFLEFVEGLPVRYRDFDFWVAAAAWLGRLQGRIDPGELSRHDFLMELDAVFFMDTAKAAHAAVLKKSPELAPRVESILDGYPELVSIMTSQPQTLVHGAYLPGQIIAQQKKSAIRICPVDWELAALGPALYDLAFLTDGFSAEKLKTLWDAYEEAAIQNGVAVPARCELARAVNCFRLHKVLNWLAQAQDRDYPQKDVCKLVNMAQELYQSASCGDNVRGNS